ncbi:MAG: sensor histidine kinase [Fibrobacteres bacterium]|nr:sensor histidine kinase [Fibrobacterota bacterium]
MSPFPNARILIVDDEEPLLISLCDTLKEHGYDTTGFLSAAAALMALKLEKFDLLLTDLMMPEMDGITLLRRALEIDPDLVGIVITGEGTISTAVEAMQIGALDYILKPFRLRVILPVLARALEVKWLRMENNRLECRVREYVGGLKAANADFETANKDLEAFSYSISHDLRAPLRHISGYSNMLKERFAGQLPEEAGRLIATITASCGNMDKLIEDLLRFSRTSRQAMSKGPLGLKAMVADVLDGLSGEQSGRHIEIRIGDLQDGIGDAALIRQVFVNLLSNGFKFTRKTKDAVLEVGCEHKDGKTVYFIRDNGAGFDMKNADKLFGVFQRLHLARDFEGTGVGLSIVQRIIQRHGGRIWAESEVDKGATFFFTLSP